MLSRKTQAREFHAPVYRLTTFGIGVMTVVLLLYAPWYLSVIIACTVMTILAYRNILPQALKVCGIGLPAWKVRVSSAGLIIISSFAVACAVLAIEFVQGSLEQALTDSGRDDVLIIMRQGSGSEMQSIIPKDTATLVQALLEPSSDGGGIARISAETLVVSDIKAKNGHVISGVQVSGVALTSMASVRPGVKLVEGRMPRQGMREVIIGRSLSRKLGGVQPGQW